MEGAGGDAHRCAVTWDEVLCWPETPRGSLASIPCFKEFNGIIYHGKTNASRYCHENGTWEERANYSDCIKAYNQKVFNEADSYQQSEFTSLIYLAGYSLSLITLSIATWIFSYCKDLRCLRNTIHANLFITYILTDSLWIISLSLELFLTQYAFVSCVIVVLLHYCHVTTFFWMFVEGHYLYMLVVRTFSADKIRCRLYMLVGWGVPLLVMGTWALVKSQTAGPAGTRAQSEVQSGSSVQRLQLEPLGYEDSGGQEPMLSRCLWLAVSYWDWLFMVPTILVLSFNFIFLIRIMWVLITKLRSTNSAETQQYKKATKALLVLLPLLGLTYILVFVSPGGGVVADVFAYLQPILISTQGLTVALIYCFFNSEVRASIKTHYRRWKMEKSFGRSPEDSLRPFHVNRRRSSATEMTFMTADPNGHASVASGRTHRLSAASQGQPDTV
ncbi:diuretic hormone receptor-like [Pollicipes pollicipes]|uniref:diuretic hormone receptor-like n=1 Tax=Pollicipes pollicipes TaxID=41117 RepID=UPI001884EE0E|nr:diuretic hormone receptor-like [Pollicipes pollicipes]